MQLKIYCQACGSPSIYITAKPKFCGECGHSFGNVVKANTTKKVKRPVVVEEIGEELEEEDDISIPDISNSKVEIQEFSTRGQKFEEVYARGASGFSRPPGKSSIQDIQNEAKNASKPIELGGNDE